jgi:hypothetical protein
MPACILALERTYCQVLQRRGLIQKSVLIVVRVIATRVCVAGLGLRYSTIATSAQRRRSGANRVPISSSFTSAAPAFDSDVAGKAVPLGPYSRLLSGRLPQLGPYVTFERGARPISGHETGGSGHRTAVYLRSSAAGTSFIGPGAGAVPGAGWGNAVDAAVWKVMLPFF